MFWNKKKILILLALALALSVAKADYIIETPTIHSPGFATAPSISTDNLTLYVDAPDGSGGWQIVVVTRETIHDDWVGPVFPAPPNSAYSDGNPDISADDLTLFFNSDRPGGHGGKDMWMTTRATKDDPWSEPVNLGPTINGPYDDVHPSISADALLLFFSSNRPGGSGDRDIWLSTRATINDPWSEPMNLGSIVNSSSWDSGPDISSDGLTLFFDSERPGGHGLQDIWVTRRVSREDPWSVPVNLGPVVNNSGYNHTSCISADGSNLYFYSDGHIRLALVNPIVDFNGDGNIDTEDLLIMIDNWESSETLCDIGPTPLGDGVVDIEDLIVFMEYWEQENIPQEPEDIE